MGAFLQIFNYPGSYLVFQQTGSIRVQKTLALHFCYPVYTLYSVHPDIRKKRNYSRWLLLSSRKKGSPACPIHPTTLFQLFRYSILRTPTNMISSTFGPSLTRRDTGKSSVGNEPTLGGIPPPMTSGGGAFGPQSASAIYQHIHDMATKRMATLDYLRKALVHLSDIWDLNNVKLPQCWQAAIVTKVVYIGSTQFIFLEQTWAGCPISSPENCHVVQSTTSSLVYHYRHFWTSVLPQWNTYVL